MTLRFHRELYDGNAVDAAAKQYRDYAELALSEEPDYWVVEVRGGDSEALRAVAGELANYALGLTIEQRTA